MENQEMTVNVNVEQKKSNAAWICGLIGFITSIPNTLCALLCAGAAAAASGIQEDGTFDEAAADKAAGGAAAYFWVIVLVSIVCFVLAFMGKKKNSLATGVAILVGGVFILINGFIGFGSMLWGTATGGLYIASGIVSILNNKRGN